jgi:hypothetical protein
VGQTKKDRCIDTGVDMKQYLYVNYCGRTLMVYIKSDTGIRYLGFDGTREKSSYHYLPGEPIEVDFI